MQAMHSDFTTVADRYDATRHIPADVLSRCHNLLEVCGHLPSSGLILDAGCGTGQISLPLAARGLDVVGIDVSAAMVAVAAGKAQGLRQARYEVGDVCAIAYPTATFDAVVFSKLLLHVRDWRRACRELVRVVKPGCCIMQLLDRGAFGNAVRREFARRAGELGFNRRLPGPAATSGEIPDHMRALGCNVREMAPIDLRWERQITRREALQGFRERLFAEFWSLPHDAYERVLAETSAWSLRQPGGLDEVERLTPYLVLQSYRTAASE